MASLAPVPGSPFRARYLPLAVAVDPTGKFAYVANAGEFGTFRGSVSAYSIGANGALTPVPGSPFEAGLASHSVAVDPTGKFAYVVNAGSHNVSAFSIGTDGALTPLTRSPFAAGERPRSVAVDPSGKFAYVANGGSNNVSGYRIDRSTGALDPVPGSPFAAGSGPISVAITPLVPFASSFR